LGGGVGVLGFGLWAPTPKPPIPNPQSPFYIKKYLIVFNYLYIN